MFNQLFTARDLIFRYMTVADEKALRGLCDDLQMITGQLEEFTKTGDMPSELESRIENLKRHEYASLPPPYCPHTVLARSRKLSRISPPEGDQS